MKTSMFFLIFLLSLLSLSTFAAPITSGLKIEGPQTVLETLSATHPEFQNPWCLARNVRVGENQDLLIATGHYISALAFEKRTITVEERPVDVMHVTVSYKHAAGISTEVTAEFNCQFAPVE
ncbi:MAG: hypothetical protein WCG27_08785 [Pseudomonadota bacterium]